MALAMGDSQRPIKSLAIMIVNKYLLILIALLSINSYANENCNQMRTFDINKFEENKVKITGVYEWSYKTADSTYLLQQGRGAYYLETVTLNGTTLKTVYSYYKNGHLESTQEIYYSTSVGKSRKYNLQGELILEDDFDEGYDFTMEDVRMFLKKKFGVDIKTPEAKQLGVKVSRSSSELNFDGIPTYTIFKPTTSRYEGELLILDGKTGQILSHKDEKGNELTRDEAYQKENEVYLHPSKISSIEHRDWTPLID